MRARLLAATLVIAAGCTPLPRNVNPLDPGDDGEVGLPVLSFDWKYVVTDRARELKPQEFASPAVSLGRLYVGSADGMFYAFTEGGKVAWKKKLGATSSRPLVHRGRIYLGTDDGLMLCLDTWDGSEKWRYSTRGAILEPPVLDDDSLIFSNEADQVYALDPGDGKFRWQHKTETPEEYTLRGHAGVAVDDGLAFTGFANGTVVALRTGTGSVAWMTSLKGGADRFVDVDGTPVVSGDTVYVTSSAGGVYALDKTTGLVRWRLPIEGAGGLVADADARLLFVVAADAGVHAVDLDGNVVWRQGTRGGGEPATPIVSGEYLVYALSEDGLFIHDKRTGKLYQYFDPGAGVSAQPTLEHDRMYLLSNRGILYAMDVNRF